jgi:hypothetical protein
MDLLPPWGPLPCVDSPAMVGPLLAAVAASPAAGPALHKAALASLAPHLRPSPFRSLSPLGLRACIPWATQLLTQHPHDVDMVSCALHVLVWCGPNLLELSSTKPLPCLGSPVVGPVLAALWRHVRVREVATRALQVLEHAVTTNDVCSEVLPQVVGLVALGGHPQEVAVCLAHTLRGMLMNKQWTWAEPALREVEARNPSPLPAVVPIVTVPGGGGGGARGAAGVRGREQAKPMCTGTEGPCTTVDHTCVLAGQGLALPCPWQYLLSVHNPPMHRLQLSCAIGLVRTVVHVARD